MKINDKHTIWYEKYRPQLVQDLVLPDKILKKFQEFIEKPTHILLSSVTPGTGKTSTVNAIIRESGLESIFINASKDNSIDLLRGKILQFASTESFDNRKKIVVLDECDGFSDSAQSALRGFIEEFSSNCVFIITCNYLTKLIPPIVNRFEVYNFDEIFRDTNSTVPLIFKRLKFILDNEKIEYTDADVLQVIRNYYPSIRQMVGVLQKSVIPNDVQTDKIGKLEITLTSNEDFTNLLEAIRKKDFESIIKAVYSITNSDGFYTWAFNQIRLLKSPSQAIITLAKYQYQNAFVRDKQLNLGACCTELMGIGV